MGEKNTSGADEKSGQNLWLGFNQFILTAGKTAKSNLDWQPERRQKGHTTRRMNRPAVSRFL